MSFEYSPAWWSSISYTIWTVAPVSPSVGSYWEDTNTNPSNIKVRDWTTWKSLTFEWERRANYLMRR